MCAYSSLLTTPVLFTTAENTSKHFKLSIIQKTLIIPVVVKVPSFPYFLKIQLELETKKSETIFCFHAQSSQPSFLSQLIFYRAAGKTSHPLNRFGLHYLFCIIFFCNLFFHSIQKFKLNFWVDILSAQSHFLYDLLSLAQIILAVIPEWDTITTVPEMWCGRW